MAQLKNTTITGDALVQGNVHVTGKVNSVKLTEEDSDVLRIPILKTLDLSTVNNEVRISLPDGYVFYPSIGEQYGSLKYCAMINGYGPNFTSYSATLTLSITSFNLDINTVTPATTYVTRNSTYTQSGVSLIQSSPTTLSMQAPDAYAIKGGTDIVIKVASTGVPADFSTRFPEVIPKILIFGTLYGFKRKLS